MNHLPPGAVDLSPQAMPMPKTQHVTTLKSSLIQLNVAVDEDNIVRGYQIQITDVPENHVYILPIESVRMKNDILQAFADAPDIGFPNKSEQDG